MIIELLSFFLKDARDEEPVNKIWDLDKRRRIAEYLFYIMMDERSLRALYCYYEFDCLL